MVRLILLGSRHRRRRSCDREINRTAVNNSIAIAFVTTARRRSSLAIRHVVVTHNASASVAISRCRGNALDRRKNAFLKRLREREREGGR